MNWYKKSQISSDYPTVAVMSLAEAAFKIDQIVSFGTHLISIRNNKENKINNEMYAVIDSKIDPNKILICVFDDLWADWQKGPNSKMPEVSDIKTILDWVKEKYKNGQRNFIVHCTGGVARSASVAILINAMFQGAEKALEKFNPKKHSPNERIIDMSNELLGISGLTKNVLEKEKEEKEPIEINNIF